jgi:stress-induced morphogen
MIQNKIKDLFKASSLNVTSLNVIDERNDGRHFKLDIASPDFKDLSLVSQHQQVYKILKPLFDADQIHALKINTSYE